MMKCSQRKKTIFCCLLPALLCYCAGNVNAQNKIKGVMEDFSARITVLSGGNVPFIFNSIDKWRNGITYSNWTRLGISFVDSADLYIPEWVLYFEANDNNNDGVINGDGGNTIPFNVLELTASNAAGLPAGPCPPGIDQTCYAGTLALSDIKQALVTSRMDTTNQTTHQINITYDCGRSITVPNSLMNDINAVPDYYVEEIIFTLCAPDAFGGCE